MLEQVLQYLNNWFVSEIYKGTFTIEDGGIESPQLLDGQYFRIIGSIFNDGLYQYGSDLQLTDETFTGAIWALAVPNAVIKLAEDIAAWQTHYGETVQSPYTSESFGGYSYSKGSGNDSDNGWQAAFASQLAPYRKIRETAPVEATWRYDPPYHRPFNPDFPWG